MDYINDKVNKAYGILGIIKRNQSMGTPVEKAPLDVLRPSIVARRAAVVSARRHQFVIAHIEQLHIGSVGDDLNQNICKSRFKSFPMTYDFDLNQFSSHDS